MATPLVSQPIAAPYTEEIEEAQPLPAVTPPATATAVSLPAPTLAAPTLPPPTLPAPTLPAPTLPPPALPAVQDATSVVPGPMISPAAVTGTPSIKLAVKSSAADQLPPTATTQSPAAAVTTDRPAASGVTPPTPATTSNIRLHVKSTPTNPSTPADTVASSAVTEGFVAPSPQRPLLTTAQSPAVAIAVYPLGESPDEPADMQLDDPAIASSPAAGSQLDEPQLDESQFDESQLDESQLDESQLDDPLPAAVGEEELELSPQSPPETVYPVAPSIDDFPVGQILEGQPTNLVAGEATTLSFRRPVVAVGSMDVSVCQAVVVSDSSVAVLAQRSGESQIEIVFAGGDRYRTTLTVLGKRTTATDEAATRVALAEQSVAQMFPNAGLSLTTTSAGRLRVQGQAASEAEAREIISLVRKMFLVPIEDQITIRR